MEKEEEEHMDWRDELKGTVGVTDEKEIADLTDMEERELLWMLCGEDI